MTRAPYAITTASRPIAGNPYEDFVKTRNEVTGDLTLHGETKSITIKLLKVGTGDMKGTAIAGYETTFTIKRTDFGMTQMLPGAGDEVTLTIAAEVAKK